MLLVQGGAFATLTMAGDGCYKIPNARALVPDGKLCNCQALQA